MRLRVFLAKALIALSQASLGARIEKLPVLARRIAEALQLSARLETGGTLAEEELAVIFLEFYADAAREPSGKFRLWVEGDSDCRILKLAARLVQETHNHNLAEGLLILPLGEGREGGTSKAIEVVMARQTRRNGLI